MNKFATSVMTVLSFVCLSSASYADMPAAPATVDCSSLSSDEQQFAAQLSSANQAIFCGQMNETQRATAMQLAQTPGSTGAMMTPDEAVQKVAAGANLVPAQKSTGGCSAQ